MTHATNQSALGAMIGMAICIAAAAAFTRGAHAVAADTAPVTGAPATGASANGAPANGGAATGGPNILLIMIDDLGWMDLRCQGNERLETPHIDRLARQGMRFTDAYAAAPVCSPTRAAVLTGQAPARLRITNHLPDSPRFTPKDAKLLPAACIDHLPLEHVTIAERLGDAGYATAFIGKWHLCGDWSSKDMGKGDPRYHPEHQGFDLNIGGCAMGGPPTFFDPYRIHNIPPRKKGEYLPDRLADETIAFMRNVVGKDLVGRPSRPSKYNSTGETPVPPKPFFIALWPYTVHWPMEAPAALIDKYAAREKGPGYRDHRYAAMIEAMDSAVGKVLAALDEMKLADDTIVIFTSDNGGFGGVADNRPLRGDKGDLYEGGIRVPLIIRHPGAPGNPGTTPGSVCNTPVISMDFYPTLLAAAGLKPDATTPLDGEDITPLLTQSGGLKRDALFFHYPNYAWHRGNRLGGAVRIGDYKLIERFDDDSVELYNLKDDRGEKNDLAKTHPDLAAKMKQRLQDWREKVNAAMPKRVNTEPRP